MLAHCLPAWSPFRIHDWPAAFKVDALDELTGATASADSHLTAGTSLQVHIAVAVEIPQTLCMVPPKGMSDSDLSLTRIHVRHAVTSE